MRAVAQKGAVHLASGPEMNAVAFFLFGAAACMLQQMLCHAMLVDEANGREDRDFQLSVDMTPAGEHEAQTANNPSHIRHRQPFPS